MNAVRQVNEFLLDRGAQPVVDALGRWFGVTVAQVASWLLTADLALWFSGNALRYLDGTHGAAMSIAVVVTLPMLAWYRNEIVKRAERATGTTRNPNRYYLETQRPWGVFLTVALCTPIDLNLNVGNLTCLTSFYISDLGFYLASCDAAPPKHVASRALAQGAV